jgi:hypothetical protein
VRLTNGSGERCAGLREQPHATLKASAGSGEYAVVNTTMAMPDRRPIMNRVTAKPLTISTGIVATPGEAPPT